MKNSITIGISVGIVVALALLFLWSNRFTQRLQEDINGLVNEAVESARQDDWENARIKMSEAKGIWQDVKKTLTMILEHDVVVDINTPFEAAVVGAEFEDLPQLVESAAQLLQNLRDGCDIERLQLQILL
ncbi:MAG: DUF4363 family protein [Christensenellales bacterium]|jgi:hypothetical protein